MKTVAYVAVMALVTYLIRAVPFTLFRKKVKSEFVKAFLEYIPYAVLGAMTVPWIFEQGKNPLCAGIGFVAAAVLAFFEKPLIVVAATGCVATYIAGFVF